MWVLVHHGWLSWASCSVAMFNSVNRKSRVRDPGFRLRMGIFIMDTIVRGHLQHMFLKTYLNFKISYHHKVKYFNRLILYFPPQKKKLKKNIV